jgi:hypothetical protein
LNGLPDLDVNLMDIVDGLAGVIHLRGGYGGQAGG